MRNLGAAANGSSSGMGMPMPIEGSRGPELAAQLFPPGPYSVARRVRARARRVLLRAERVRTGQANAEMEAMAQEADEDEAEDDEEMLDQLRDQEAKEERAVAGQLGGIPDGRWARLSQALVPRPEAQRLAREWSVRAGRGPRWFLPQDALEVVTPRLERVLALDTRESVLLLLPAADRVLRRALAATRRGEPVPALPSGQDLPWSAERRTNGEEDDENDGDAEEDVHDARLLRVPMPACFFGPSGVAAPLSVLGLAGTDFLDALLDLYGRGAAEGAGEPCELTIDVVVRDEAEDDDEAQA